MKKSMSLIVTAVGLMFGVTTAPLAADTSLIKEVNNADLGPLAHKATKENKQLMLIYYRDNCVACEQLVQGQKKAQQLSQDFALYKTNVSSGFKVVCPNGQQFSDTEFMAIKGIETLPAVVITDSDGNVVHVANDVNNKTKLIAAGEAYKKHRLADGALAAGQGLN